MMKTAAAAVAMMFAAQPAAADPVTDWMDLAMRLGNAQQSAPGPRMPEAERATTRTALAMFEALNALDRRYRSYLNLQPGPAGASQDAAAATAAYRILVHHYPQHKASIEESWTLAMEGIGDSAAREAGKAIGEQAAAAALAAGGIDPKIAQTPYRPATAMGVWVATALPSLEPYWAAYKPWAVQSYEALRPPPPPALGSERWAKDYEEVRRLGGKTSSERTPYQTLVARYRQAFDTMPALRMVTEAPGRTMVQNARFFTVYQMAFDDAATAMVVAKQHYGFWRPLTAIRNGEEDGNPATKGDPAWVPLLGTPNFQEYPCGHCTVAAAIAEVMKAETGNAPKYGVRVISQAIPNSVVQVLPTWDAWAREVSDSRIFGGVHYRFSNEAGEEIGRKAARIAMETLLQPLEPAKGARKR
jgi:hypothetical protein